MVKNTTVNLGQDNKIEYLCNILLVCSGLDTTTNRKYEIISALTITFKVVSPLDCIYKKNAQTERVMKFNYVSFTYVTYSQGTNPKMGPGVLPGL